MDYQMYEETVINMWVMIKADDKNYRGIIINAADIIGMQNTCTS